MHANLTYLCGKQKVKAFTIDFTCGSPTLVLSPCALLFAYAKGIPLGKKKNYRVFLEMPF